MVGVTGSRDRCRFVYDVTSIFESRKKHNTEGGKIEYAESREGDALVDRICHPEDQCK